VVQSQNLPNKYAESYRYANLLAFSFVELSSLLVYTLVCRIAAGCVGDAGSGENQLIHKP
jgi:hypothetical protein